MVTGWSPEFDVYYCRMCWKWHGEQCKCKPGELCIYSVSNAGKMPPDARDEGGAVHKVGAPE